MSRVRLAGPLHSVPGPEPAGEGGIDLLGGFHGQVLELTVKVGGVVKLDLVGQWGVPEDVALRSPGSRGER